MIEGSGRNPGVLHHINADPFSAVPQRKLPTNNGQLLGLSSTTQKGDI